MCGIVGYTGTKLAKSILIDGLHRLEYRGYDSAGLALAGSEDFSLRRAVGQVSQLEIAAKDVGQKEVCGIAHTRWATHGAPNEINAHPHRTQNLVLVHNGIIENYAELKQALAAKGVEFSSQTDTEVFARHLEDRFHEVAKTLNTKFEAMSVEQKKQTVHQALRQSVTEAEGHYAVMFMVKGLDGLLFGAHNGAPLVFGRTEHGLVVASDLQAIVPHTKTYRVLRRGCFFEMGPQSDKVWNLSDGKEAHLKTQEATWSTEQSERGGYPTFMLKEIHEQPQVIAQSLSGRLPQNPQDHFLWDDDSKHQSLWRDKDRVYLIACGTAFYSGMVAKYFFEQIAGVPMECDLASEFRYRHPVLNDRTLVGVISQSGETADTLAALRLAKEKNCSVFSICNVPGSTVVQESDFNYPTKAGPEIGVASTKAFTAQLTVLASLALSVAQRRGREQQAWEAYQALSRLPHDFEQLLERSQEFRSMGAKLEKFKTILFVGRNSMYPIALEAALKLKEITYRHAEGYAAGELKHGPIAMVDENLVAVVLAPKNEMFKKTLSNLEEIKARKGHIIGLGETDCQDFRNLCDLYIEMPKVEEIVAPMLYVLPCQLMAYGMAEALGCNIDKPRNLAKSVTVE